MMPSRCSSLSEAHTITTMPSVCSPSVSHAVPSMAPCPGSCQPPGSSTSALQLPNAHVASSTDWHGPCTPGHLCVPPSSCPKSRLRSQGRVPEMLADRQKRRGEESLIHSAVLVVLCSYLSDCTQAFSFTKREGWEWRRKREGGTEGGRQESSRLKEGTLQPYRQTWSEACTEGIIYFLLLLIPWGHIIFV